MANGGVLIRIRSLFIGFMLIPAISVVLTKLITKEWMVDMGLKPVFAGIFVVMYCGLAGDTFIDFIGCCIIFYDFSREFDPKI